MKMLLFRPTFVPAAMIFSLMIMFCALAVSSVSAAPQFGRPLLHVLDESPTGLASSTVDLSRAASFILTSSALPTVTASVNPSGTSAGDCTAQAPEVDPINVANPTESPTTMVTSSFATASLTLTQTNGAPHLLDGINVAIVLSAAASAVLVVF